METAVFDVFVLLLVGIWEIEKLEFQQLDALITNCTAQLLILQRH